MIRITNLNNINIAQIRESLLTSGIIVFPTETVWGLGARFDDENAIKRLYEIKGRDFANPLQIQVSSFEDIKKYSDEPYEGKFKTLCENILPGALTVVTKKKNVPDFVTSNLDTVGIRYSSCKDLTNLIELLGFPIASTSCNKSGEPVITDIDEIIEFAKNYADVLLEIDCKVENVSSTIVNFDNGNLKLLREGSIDFETIKSKIGI